MNVNWHRLFGLVLCDLFAGSPWIVELEKDLSLKQQFLDVVIMRRGPGEFSGKLPDGLDNLADHNLLSYKSLHEPLDDWSLKELTGHYVNYRKQVTLASGEMSPESAFRLFGISTRYPQKLAGQIPLEERQPGVYEVKRGTDQIRVIVLTEISRETHNSVWHLFSTNPETIRFGAEHHRPHTSDTSTILSQLFETYRMEGFPMPYTMEDFRRDFTREHLTLLTPDERLKGLAPDERLKGLAADELAKRLKPEERLKGLAPEQRLIGLTAEERKLLLEGLKQAEGEG